MFPKSWLLALAAAVLWTTVFSFSTVPGIRGWRNLGILACYGIGVALFILLPWQTAAVIWLIPGVAAGLLYFGYEVWQHSRSTEREEFPRPVTILHGIFAWPVMLPEVIEYTLAEFGILRVRSSEPPPSNPDAGRNTPT